MKKIFFLLIAAVSLTFNACDKVTYDAFANITGQVIDKDSQDAIDGASINLSPTGKSTFTGSDGYFDFQELEAQQYTITVQKTGYCTNRKTINAVAGESENITITLTKSN